MPCAHVRFRLRLLSVPVSLEGRLERGGEVDRQIRRDDRPVEACFPLDEPAAEAAFVGGCSGKAQLSTVGSPFIRGRVSVAQHDAAVDRAGKGSP